MTTGVTGRWRWGPAGAVGARCSQTKCAAGRPLKRQDCVCFCFAGDIAMDVVHPLLFCIHPHACASQSATFDRAVEKDGWPTLYEHTVSESRALRHVFCPVCGAHDQVIRFANKNLRWAATSGYGTNATNCSGIVPQHSAERRAGAQSAAVSTACARWQRPRCLRCSGLQGGAFPA